jgi:hypothetical protein
MVTSYLMLYYLNGRQAKESKELEVLFKTVSVSADGGDNGLNISESSGKFDFNTKVIGNISAGGATGEAVEYDQMNTALGDYVPTSQKGAANGVATLGADSKIPSAQLPALVISSVSVVADETAQLALTAEEGDMAIRTDNSKSYIHNGGSAGTMADWTEITAPGDVSSVNSQTGTVVLDSDDIGEGSTNLYHTAARVKAAAVADSITDAVTDVAPSQNAVFDALALKSDTSHNHSGVYSPVGHNHDGTYSQLGHTHTASEVTDLVLDLGIEEDLTNDEGGSTAHTIREVVYVSAAGNVKLAQANGTFDEGDIFYMVKDASIADQASGTYYAPAKGTKVAGFTGLTVGAKLYISRTTPGGYATSLSGYQSGEHVISIGRAISATTIIFDPQ